jgi:hypothetical protein
LTIPNKSVLLCFIDGERSRFVMAIPVSSRGDFKAFQLRSLARKTKDGPQARRLLTLAAIYDGATRTEAAKIGGVTLQIIRDWVMRFNARGCLVPSFDGALLSHDSRDALWDKFYTAAPPRRRQSVEQYKIVKRA